MYGVRISELTEQYKEESKGEELELKLVQEKLRAELERLALLKLDFRVIKSSLIMHSLFFDLKYSVSIYTC